MSWMTPAKETVLAELGPVLDHIVEWLEKSIEAARSTLRDQGLRLDPHLFASLVRAGVISRIETLAKVPLNENGDRIELCSPPMLGIWLAFAGYKVRAYKAPAGGWPLPPKSPGKARFFLQLPPEQGTMFEEEKPPKAHIVIFWSVDADMSLTEIRVVLPRGWDASQLRREWVHHMDLDSGVAQRAAAFEVSAADAASEELQLELEEEVESAELEFDEMDGR